MSQAYETLKIGAAPEPAFTAAQVKQVNTHVNKDWWNKTLSFQQGMEIAQIAAEDRRDITAKTSEISAVVDNGEFKFSIRGDNFTPTDWAMTQFATKSNMPSSSVLRELRNTEGFDHEDAETMVKIANNSLRRIDMDKEFIMRTYADGTLRAMVTDRYAPIDNRWYLEVLQEFLPGGRLSHWRGDEDTIYGNILLPDTIMDYGQGDDSDYGGMISIGNCEIGKRRLSQFPSIFRSICFNGNIWGRESGKKVSRRHVGKINLDDIKKEIAENIQYQMPLLSDGIKKFLDTRAMKVEDVNMMKAIAAVVLENKIDKKQGAEIYNQWSEHESNDRNLFGIINAVTRAGQTFDNANFVKFDEIGGALTGMTTVNWNRLLKRAETLEAKDIQSILAVAA
jgi:hypothetical protein